MKNRVIGMYLASIFLFSVSSLSGCGKQSEIPGEKGGSFWETDPQGKIVDFRYITCYDCSDEKQNCYADSSQCLPGGCTTGKHSATNLEEACAILNNKAENHDCTTSLRQKRF